MAWGRGLRAWGNKSFIRLTGRATYTQLEKMFEFKFNPNLQALCD
ncbi:MAG TPA: hypothetical protein VGE24_14030 [Emticicia sp.]